MITDLHDSEREKRRRKKFQHFDDLRDFFPKKVPG